MSAMKMSGITAAAVLGLMLARPGAASAADGPVNQERSARVEARGAAMAAQAPPAVASLARLLAGAGAADLMSHQGSTFDSGRDRLASSPEFISCVEIMGITVCCMEIIYTFCWVQ